MTMAGPDCEQSLAASRLGHGIEEALQGLDALKLSAYPGDVLGARMEGTDGNVMQLVLRGVGIIGEAKLVQPLGKGHMLVRQQA